MKLLLRVFSFRVAEYDRLCTDEGDVEFLLLRDSDLVNEFVSELSDVSDAETELDGVGVRVRDEDCVLLESHVEESEVEIV